MKRVVLASCLAATLSPAVADPRTATIGNSKVQIFDGAPRRVVIQTVAPTQQDVRILGRNHTDPQCRVAAETHYELLKPALHGVVCFRDEIGTAKLSATADKPRCGNVPTMFRVVYYRPAGNYVGQDAFQYSVVEGAQRLVSIADASVTLTPPLSAPAADAADPQGETAQRAGPMPRCPDPLM